ncbi:hypothetical protein [Microbacterium sp. 179-I 3D4 NHS]|uniref:hypothetical protein n=1 Tax=Microbacterium sp. 179-I 3D4 NHS TaxID=3142381 RepID=UPI0039A032AA
MTPDVRHARTAFLWVGVVVPLAIVAVSAIVITLWLPEIPDPAAVHWSESGPDGFGPGWTHLVLLGVIAVLIAAFAVLAWFAHRLPEKGRSARASGAGTPQWSVTARFLGAVNLGLAALISLVSLAGVGSQRGLADAADAPGIGYAVLGGLLLLVVGSLAGWFLQPRTPEPPAPRTEPAAPLDGSGSERVMWVGTASIARSGRGVFGATLLVVAALAAIMAATGSGGTMAVVITLAAGAVVLLALVTTFAFRVRIGPAGLRVRSLAGWPRIDIAAADIASTRVIDVDPFAEFGGWGVRYALDGRYGVVLRRGAAVEVTRTSGRRFVVTVDDAETAAAALATAAQRATSATKTAPGS